MAQPANGAQPDAPDDAPDALAQMPDIALPDQHIVNGWKMEVTPGPGGRGGRFLVVHCFNRGEALLFDFSDDADADRLADELKPSRLVKVESGLVKP